MRYPTPHAVLCAILALPLAPLLWLPLGASAQATGAPARTSAAHLQLGWEVVRSVFPADAPGGRSVARFTLTNLDSQTLPPQGWGIYFNCIDGVQPATLDGHLVLEQVSGQLFRLRPAPGFQGLATGQTLAVDFRHSVLVFKAAKAPVGPYLAFDDAPETGQAIGHFQIAMMSRPEQLDTGPLDTLPLSTAESIFARNEIIAEVQDGALPPVFPTPLRLERQAGTLHLPGMPVIHAAPALRNEARFAKTLLTRYLAAAQPGTPALTLSIGKIAGQASPEAYELSVDPVNGIAIRGASAAGVFLALQSLRDLLPLTPQTDRSVELPALRISDAPRFAYRGFQLDVARNFHPKATVFKLLDLMARYKLNTFHFHLTDDEGWRLEIAGLSELTSFGARRGHTLSVQDHLQPAYGSGPDLNDPHGSGYYSRADYIEILKYAAARHIEVIPELEMPGHARAAVKAMEHRSRRLEQLGNPNARQFLLNDFADQSEYTSPQLYHDQVLNPGLASTYAFIDHVIADVVSMHRQAGVPLRTIHVGGDELPTGAWEKSPASHALMKRMNLATSAELWDYFYGQVDRILRRHGLFASGWEELGARKVKLNGAQKLIPNPVFSQRGFQVYVWNNLDGAEDFAYRLANAGYGTVLAPVTNFYFDMAYNKNPDEPGVHWGAYIDLDTVYDFIPFDYLKNAIVDPARKQGKDGLTDFGQKQIRGLEATLFTETVRDQERIDYLVMPRMLGLAERAWAADPAWAREPDSAKAAAMHDQAWSQFVHELGRRVLPRLDADQADVAYRIPPPGLRLKNGRVLANHQLPGFALRYTVNGEAPGRDSALVAGPITAHGTVRVAAFARDGRAGPASSIEIP